MSGEIPAWTTLKIKIGDIKSIPDFDLLFCVNFEDYLTSIRQYSRINKEKRDNFIKSRVKSIYERSAIIAIVDKEIPNIVYSFVACEFHGKKLVVHFCYTKEGFRKNGFISYLLKLLEFSKTKFSYFHPTSEPKTHTLFKKYKMEKEYE